MRYDDRWYWVRAFLVCLLGTVLLITAVSVIGLGITLITSGLVIPGAILMTFTMTFLGMWIHYW